MIWRAEKTDSKMSLGLKTDKVVERPEELWREKALLNKAPKWTDWLRERKLSVCKERERLAGWKTL